MTKPHLRACPACARHVRVNEPACPFCGGPLGDAFHAAVAPSPPRTSLTRAALFAFGTGTLALAPGCSSSPSGSPVVDGGGSEDSSSPVVDAAYGGPPIGSDAGGIAPAYGGAPVNTDGGQGIAAYGGAPIETDGGH